MNFEDTARELESRIRDICHTQARYRVLWVVGGPCSGKSSLCRYICTEQGWRYINFTLDPGFLDSLIGREEIYRPEDFLEDLYRWCENIRKEFVVFDELEPLLGLWDWDQQELFFRLMGRATGLPVGVILTTRSRTSQQLRKTLPGMRQAHFFELL